MQEAGNLGSERDRLWYVPQRACGVEQLALQRGRDRAPLHDDGRPEASEDVLLFVCEGDAVWSVVFRAGHGVLIIISELLLIIGKHRESLLEPLKIMPLIRIRRCVGQIAVFGCFRTILRELKHAVSLPEAPSLKSIVFVRRSECEMNVGMARSNYEPCRSSAALIGMLTFFSTPSKKGRTVKLLGARSAPLLATRAAL
jgi:hypothetical protein